MKTSIKTTCHKLCGILIVLVILSIVTDLSAGNPNEKNELFPASPNPLVSANAGPDETICGLSYQLAAMPPLSGSGIWSNLSPYTAIFIDPGSPTSIVQVAYSNNIGNVTFDFAWIVTDSTGTASDTVQITFFRQPNAAAGLNAEECGTNHTFDADILGSEYALGTWHTGFTTAVFNDNHDPSCTVTIPNTGSFSGQPLSGTFGDSSFVIIDFIWEMTNVPCNDYDTVAITFYQVPVANAGPDTAVCGKIYTMNAEFSIGASKGKWTMVSGPSAVPPTWFDNTDPQTTVQVALHGQYTFKWKEDNFHNQTCTDVDLVTIYFIEVPAPEVEPDRYVCGNETFLEAGSSTGNGQWLPTSAFILDIFNPQSYTQYGLTGTNDTVTYVWQEYNEYNGVQCVGYDAVNIVFMVQPSAQVFFDPGISLDHICGKSETPFDNIFVAQQPGITGSNIESYWIGDDAIFYPNAFSLDPDSVVVGNYGLHEFNWVVENYHGDSICVDTSTTMFVNFIEQPIAYAGPLFDTACIYPGYNDYYQFQGTWSTNGDSTGGNWFAEGPNSFQFWNIDATTGDTSMGGNYPDTYVEFIQFNPSNPMSGEFIWQEINYGVPIYGNQADFCADWDTTTITFLEGVYPIAGNDTTIELSTFVLNGSFGSPYTDAWWELQSSPLGASAIINDPDSLSTQVTLSDYGVYVFSLVGTNSVCENTDNISITYVDSTVAIESISEPENYHLSQNVPNPFASTTVFSFYLPKPAHIELAVYNLVGEKVAVVSDASFTSGNHTIEYHSAGLAPGTYLYSLQSNEIGIVRKMCIMR